MYLLYYLQYFQFFGCAYRANLWVRLGPHLLSLLHQLRLLLHLFLLLPLPKKFLHKHRTQRVVHLLQMLQQLNMWCISKIPVYKIFTDAGQYVIRFGKADLVLKTGPASIIQELDVSRPLTLSERAIAVALAISLDNDYFSRHGG